MSARRNQQRMAGMMTLVIAALMVGGCAAEGTSDSVATVSLTTPGTPQGSTPVSNEQIDPGLKPYIDIAVADLAQRLSIGPDEVGVTSATLVAWPDSALGCPEPGLQYAQVVTDGSLIMLTAGDKTYRYHAGGSRKPFLCEHPSKEPPATG